MDKFFGFAKELLARGLAQEVEAYAENNTYDTAIQFTADIDFYRGLAAKNKGPILDIGCGTGRVMLPLLQAGWEVEGIDLSPAMLAMAAAKLSAAGFTPRLHQGDMRNFQLATQFALIIIPYFALIYIASDPERRQVLACCYQHLAPGGTLAFDFDAGGGQLGLSQPWLGFQTIAADGQVQLQIVQTNQVTAQQRLANIITYRLAGAKATIEVTSSAEASITAADMETLLRETGFVVQGFYNDYSYTPYTSGEECIVVAVKP